MNYVDQKCMNGEYEPNTSSGSGRCYEASCERGSTFSVALTDEPVAVKNASAAALAKETRELILIARNELQYTLATLVNTNKLETRERKGAESFLEELGDMLEETKDLLSAIRKVNHILFD